MLVHTKQSLQADLRAMGLQPTDTVLVHSSMKAIGAVEGRADQVLDALMEYFAPGLLVLPTLTWNLEYADPPVFNALETPSVVGILPELFRTRPHVFRSLHPTHSLAAYGAEAEAFVSQDHHNHTPCGKTSAWHKLLERDAHILLVGCELTSCTFLHGVEEWCNVPHRLKAPMTFTIIAPNGTSFNLASAPHLGSPSEQYGRVERVLRDGGALTDGQFGNAHVLHCTAARTFALVSACLRENPCFFS
ncbi:MAG: AAC(3) family N-acetyltransferase [Clostridia bacterium]